MISPNFHPYVGGAERQALELSKTLQTLGVQVTVLTRHRKGLAHEESVEGVPVKRLWAPRGALSGSLGFMISVFAWLWAHEFAWDVVHVHLAGSHTLPAALAGKLLMRPVFVKIGGGRGIGEIALSSKTVSGRLKLKALGWFKPRITAVTPSLVEELEEYGLDLPVIVVPNGVDTLRFKPPAPGETKKSLRQEVLSWPQGLSFVYVGRLAPEKRLAGFIKAFAQALSETNAQAHFLVTGEGIEGPALRSLADKLGLLNKSVYFRGNVTELEKEVYLLADIFVLPSQSEGLSNALLEAMSCGLAILASRVGGTQDAVQDGVSGILFGPGDEDGMKRGIKRFLESPGDAQAMGLRARETALERFDLRQVAQQYLNLYRS